MHHSIVIKHLIALTEQLLLLFVSAIPVLCPFHPFNIVAKDVLLLLLLQLVSLLEKYLQFRRSLNLHVNSILLEVQEILILIALVTSNQLVEGGSCVIQRLEFGLEIRVPGIAYLMTRRMVMTLAIGLKRLTDHNRFC